jgi:Tfp pilus assembly protein PilF
VEDRSQAGMRAAYSQDLAALRTGRAVAAAPAFAHARTDLARAYRQDGRLEAAREELRRVLKEVPSLEGAWLAYGDVLVDLEKYVDAKFAFEQARLLDPHRQRIEEATAALVAGDRQRAEEVNL